MLLPLRLLAALGAASALTIVTSPRASPAERLAAAELRRYLHAARAAPARPALATALDAADDNVVVVTAAGAAALLGADAPARAPPAGGFVLAAPRAGLVTIVGADAQAALYGAYDYLERRGCTFTSAGPTVPARAAPDLAPGSSADGAPVFSTRGLQPFHDFAEGPDWWGEDETKRVTEAVLSMKGNLIGFHTYPLVEPAVWVGLPEDVAADGTVTATRTTYATRWATTLDVSDGQTNWGYNQLNTSDMGFGAAQIFEHDCFGHETVSGNAALCPLPQTTADNTELFNRVGAYWKASFAHAKALGVQTVLGTEIPLAMPPTAAPPPPPAGATLPLQVWYSAARNDHFITTTACAECDDMYVLLGTTGWVYANAEPNSVALCTYATTLSNGQIDNELAVCGADKGVRIEGYAPAAGTAGTAALTQFVGPAGHHWAADADWAAAATAAGFSASGVVGAVFTTGPPLPPTPNATAFYEGIFTRLTNLLGNNLTYYWGWTPESWEWDRVSINDPKIQKAVADTQQMQAAWESVSPPFALASCGWTVGPLGARWYYDTVLPPSWAITSIDMNVGNTPVDPAYANITHRTTANKWAIPWAEDDPGLTAPELWVNRSLSHARDAAAYGVGGLLSIHWRTRMTSPQIGSAHAVAWNLSLATADYWQTWALGQFGDAAVAGAAAAIFTASADSYALPRPVSWTGGPGGWTPGCAAPGTYAFVDALAALRPALVAALGSTATLDHLERFDYWLGSFVYMRSIARFTCDWAAYNAVIKAVQAIADPAARRTAAVAQGLPARVSLIANVTAAVADLLATVSSTEGAGTTYNVLSHSSWGAVGPAPTAALEALTGAPLPPSAQPPAGWPLTRAPVLRVPVLRTMLAAGEPLRVRALVLAPLAAPPANATLFWRAAGAGGAWAAAPLAQAAPEGGVPRFVFTAALPPQAGDFEWYARVDVPLYNGGAFPDSLGVPAGTVVGPASIACFVPPGGADAPQSVVIVPQ